MSTSASQFWDAWAEASPTDVVAAPGGEIAPDCAHYRGDRPCMANRLCRGCTEYRPWRGRVCVVKLGALGDVVRTLCILPELRRRMPGAQITWVTEAAGRQMLQGHPMIDRLLTFDPAACMQLQGESFDLLINLDKEPPPCALAMAVSATTKLGFGLTRFGTPAPLNDESAAFFNLGLSDELKFYVNEKSYPQLVYESLGWRYRGERYELPIDQAERDSVQAQLAARGFDDSALTVGINVGSGSRFANKMWPAKRIADVIVGLRIELPDVQIMLLGGPAERLVIDDVSDRLAETGGGERVIDGGTHHSEQGFVALVDACDMVFCGDTMAMHVAIALQKGVVAFFGPTCPQEIDLYGLGEKLISTAGCSPCYRRQCDQQDVCVGEIPTEDAVKAIAVVLARVTGRSFKLPIAPVRRAG